MANASQFKLSLEKFGGNINKVIGQLQRAAAFGLVGDLTKGSPVDTGRFRASWVVGVGTKSEETAEEGVRSKGEASQESLARLKVLTPETVDGKRPVILSNNLPYAQALADGHSGQAPSGWVQAAVDRQERELGVVKLKD